MAPRVTGDTVSASSSLRLMLGDSPVSRRDFTKLAAAAALSPHALAPHALAPHGSRVASPSASLSATAWPDYDRATVIDLLATPGPFNIGDMFGKPLSPLMVENAKRSGITGVNATVSGSGTGLAAFDSTMRAIAFWEREFDAHPDAWMKVKSLADLRRAKETKRVGVILGFQDATMLDDDVSRVDLFDNLGVRIIQLTYNVRNLLGDGCLEPANGGLSGFGRNVVARMGELGMLVDLSHCGRQTTIDGIRLSTKPVAISHSGCTAVTDVPRNKPDEILKSLADRGGVVGIYLMPFLRAKGQPTSEDFMRHLGHAIDVCGEDHVGIGSDNSITPLDITPEFRAEHKRFVGMRRARGISAPGEEDDVFTYVPDINSPRRMEIIADLMTKAGHPSSRVAKVLGGNWARLMGEVWKA